MEDGRAGAGGDLGRAQRLRRLVEAAAHDLGSPLTSILGFSTSLVEHGDRLSGEQHREFLLAVQRAARHAARIVADLTTVAETEAGDLRARAEPVEVAGAARAAVAVSGVEAAVDVPPGLSVTVDPRHLQQILVALLANAARHGSPPVAVSATADGATIEVVVSDGGEEVEAELADRVFTELGRLPGSGRQAGGVSLVAVRCLAEANGGQAFHRGSGGRAAFGVRLAAARFDPAPPG